MTWTRIVCAWVCLTSAVFAQNAPPATPPHSAPVVSEALAGQVMLDRLGFSPGEIDGRAGANLKRALTAFQTAHRLSPTGELDADTWKRLAELSSPAQPLTSYVVSPEDVIG